MKRVLMTVVTDTSKMREREKKKPPFFVVGRSRVLLARAKYVKFRRRSNICRSAADSFPSRPEMKSSTLQPPSWKKSKQTQQTALRDFETLIWPRQQRKGFGKIKKGQEGSHRNKVAFVNFFPYCAFLLFLGPFGPARKTWNESCRLL